MSPALKLSLRDYDEVVRTGYVRLFTGESEYSTDLLAWRSGANPHGKSKFAVVLDGDDVVGIIALIPTRLRGATGEILGYQAVDAVVDRAYRGQGVFVKLGAVAQDQLDADVLWGWPYGSPFQAGQPMTMTSSCNATSTWLAQATNAPAGPPAQRGERGR